MPVAFYRSSTQHTASSLRRSAVVGAETDIQALQLTATQMQRSFEYEQILTHSMRTRLPLNMTTTYSGYSPSCRAKRHGKSEKLFRYLKQYLKCEIRNIDLRNLIIFE